MRDLRTSHDLTEAQSVRAEARVKEIKQLHNQMWKILMQAESLTTAVKTTVADFLSSQVQRAVGSPWSIAGPLPPIFGLGKVLPAGLGKVLPAESAAWNMLTDVSGQALSELSGARVGLQLNTICSLNALIDVLIFFQKILKDLKVLVALRDNCVGKIADADTRVNELTAQIWKQKNR